MTISPQQRSRILAMAMLAWLMLALPLLTTLAAEAPKRVIPAIEAADDTPLGTRMPLLMVHGIQGGGEYDHWDLYVQAFEANPDFRARYKIYLYHYEPKLGVPKNSALFKILLTTFINGNHVGTMRIVAHSMGGLLVRDSADTPIFTRHVDRVIAIAVPFHGTPLTSREWVLSELWGLSPLKPVYKAAYGTVHKIFPGYAQDYAWDNFDGSLPKGSVETGQPTVEYTPVDLIQTHWILYAGFFAPNTKAKNWLADQLELPPKQARQMARIRNKRTGWLNAHRIMRITRRKISGLIPAKRGHGYPLIGFNDGIIPMGSQLWLGEFGDVRHEGSPMSDAEQLEMIRALNGIPGVTARLFTSIDHNDWLRGTTRFRHPAMTDWLHPEASSKSAEDWVLKDLLD